MMHQHMLGPSTSLTGNTNSALQSSVLSDGVLLSHSQPTREEIKKSFETREGVYRSVPSAEFSRPRPLPQYHMPAGIASAAASQMAATGSTVRVSFLNLATKSPDPPDFSVPPTSQETYKKDTNGSSVQEHEETLTDKICFNVGKELYVYSYRGTGTETDLSRPIDKRVYKGTSPTYHAFNQDSVKPGSCQLIIGFSLGQLQVIDPLEKSSPSPLSRLYNEDRYVDKTAVTCIRWLPGEPNIFLASYVSGNLYVYDDRIPASTSSSNGSSQPPSWTATKEGDKFTIYTLKNKTSKNPVTRWQIGEGGSIHQFNFSGPDARMMATVSHDGFLRVFNYHAQELVAVMKSYFGGLLTLAWSPDAKLIATGGEDDLLTVYSVVEKRVVCRGQAHKSWISQVQFDPFLCTTEDDLDISGLASGTFDETGKDPSMRSGPVPSTSADLNAGVMQTTSTFSRCSLASFNTLNGGPSGNSVCYRIGSVGHDTFLCFWDITEDMLKQVNIRRHRNSTIIAPMATLEIQTSPLVGRLEDLAEVSPGGLGSTNVSTESQNQGTLRPEKTKKKRFVKKAFGLAKFTSGSSTSNSSSSHKTGTLTNGTNANSDGKKTTPGLVSQISCCNETHLLGTKICPGIRDVPMIEPLMCKKVSHDRLTVLEFREDCVVTACQEGFICTWGRPGRYNPPKRDCINSPGTTSPEMAQKPSTTASSAPSHQNYGFTPDLANGVPPSRSSSSYSNYDQQIRSPNATSPSYRVATANTGAYHRPNYAWQNAN